MTIIETKITPENVLIGLCISAVTFVASQSWDIGKTIYREWKLRKALRKEIQEATPWLLRNITTFECMMQLSCMNAISNNGPVPIPIVVHTTHFPDIVLKLSIEEKAFVTGLYNILYELNRNAEIIRELNPQVVEDEDRFSQLRRALDTAYRNSRRALLLIQLYVSNIKNLKALEAQLALNDPIHKLEDENDQALVALAAEARSMGEEAIRKKYRDGAVSALDVAPTSPPAVGKLYFDTTGAKFRCISVEGELVEMIQLESQIGVVTYDLHFKCPITSFRHLYEIKDADEVARLERRFLALRPLPGSGR